MGKLLKILMAILGLVILLIVAAVIILPLVVDPNDFKDEITAQVKKFTGRELVINGDLGLSVFPWLGLELNGLQLSNAPGFGDQPFAAITHAQLRAKLLPLLSKSLEVDTVRVEGMQLNLAKDKTGRSNWQDLAGADTAVEPDKAKQPSQPSQPFLKGIAIGGIEVTDSRVIWDDQAGKQHYQISDLAVTTGAISPGFPMDLKLAFAVDSAQPLLKARIGLDGRVEVDEAMQKVTVSPMTLRVDDLQAEGVSGQAELTSRVGANLADQRYQLDDLKLSVSVTGEGLPNDGLKAEFLANLVADLVKETLSVADLRLSSGDLILSGALQGEKIATQPELTGHLKIAEFSPRNWMKQMGLSVPETADPKVLNRVMLDTQLKAAAKRVAFDKLVLTLDDTRVTGELRLQPPDKPGIRYELAVDAIDLDRYLPSAGEESASTDKAPAKPAETSTPTEAPASTLFPVETLRRLDVAGVLTIGQLKISKLLMQDLKLSVQAKDGRVKLEDEVSKFYEGAIKGLLALDVSGAEPKLKVDQHATDIQAGPLLKDATGKDTLTGLGRFNATLEAKGQTQAALTETLGGKLDFTFANGAVKGFNLAKMIRDAKAAFQAKSLPPDDEPAQTDFSELSGSATVTSGVLKNNDLHAKSPFIRVEGAGEVNLAAENLDYTLTPTIVSTLEGQGGKGLEELVGIPVPIRFTGALAKPDYSIDWKKVLLATQKTKIKEQTDKLHKKLEDKMDDKLKDVVPKDLQDTLKDKLKGIF